MTRWNLHYGRGSLSPRGRVRSWTDLAGDGEFTSPTVLCLWWLVLRICVIYALINIEQKRCEGGEAE